MRSLFQQIDEAGSGYISTTGLDLQRFLDLFESAPPLKAAEVRDILAQMTHGDGHDSHGGEGGEVGEGNDSREPDITAALGKPKSRMHRVSGNTSSTSRWAVKAARSSICFEDVWAWWLLTEHRS